MLLYINILWILKIVHYFSLKFYMKTTFLLFSISLSRSVILLMKLKTSNQLGDAKIIVLEFVTLGLILASIFNI